MSIIENMGDLKLYALTNISLGWSVSLFATAVSRVRSLIYFLLLYILLATKIYRFKNKRPVNYVL